MPEKGFEYKTGNSTVGKALQKDKLRDTLPLVNDLLKSIKVMIYDG